VFQDFEACHLREIQVEDDDIRYLRLADLRKCLDGFLSVMAALDLGRYALEAQSFFHQKHIRIVVFDDKTCAGLPEFAIERARGK
jgi:hypothetical protein